MKIEAVIVCKDYSDFLEHTLATNLPQLDRLVVVTHPKDRDTQRLCNHYGVDFVETEIFTQDGDAFNKARAINLGLSHLKHDGWLLHLDADIVLPHMFRDMLKRHYLQPDCLYGADRLNVVSYENWAKHKHKTVPQHQWRYLTVPTAEFPLGARLIHKEYGFVPCGYFQLWHSSMKRKYPIVSGSAEHSDIMFGIQWAREKRHLIPEFLCYHLESTSEFGANWNGRKSPPFKPKPYCPK